MRRKVALWVILYLAFMIGYFLLITVLLPSTVAFDPDWIRIGSFAEYNVQGGELHGTYTWSVVAIENRVVTINETFQGSTQWDHVAIWNNTRQAFENVIPPSGRMSETDSAAGTIEDLVLWMKRYYNQILIDRTFILGTTRYIWLIAGESQMPFQGQTIQTLHLKASTEWEWSLAADYDKATGILMLYSWTWPHLGTLFVSLESTNIFTSAMNESKLFLDLLVIAPLIMLPLIGVAKGLSIIRHNGVGFSKRFWQGIILLNGGLFAVLSNFPINIQIFFFAFIQSANSAIGLLALSLFLVNIAFWTALLGAAILVINRFATSVIAEND